MSSFTAVSGRAQLLRPSKGVRVRSAACSSVRRARLPLHCSLVDEGSSKHSLDRRALLQSAAAASILTHQGQALATGATCEDFSTGEGGLQFCDATVGGGKEPVKGAMIRCHYTGRLASTGKVFDSSYNRGLPLNFKVGVREVIQGWDMGILGAEGIPPMKEGGKRRLVIPSDLAYGSRSVGGGLIPADSDLIFDVELLPPRKR